MTLAETYSLHYRHPEGVCVCGANEDRNYYYEHVSSVIKDWLAEHGYGLAIGFLYPGTTCLRCGVIVGNPDVHERACVAR